MPGRDSWDDGGNDEDVLDLHTRAAYKYATMPNPGQYSSENSNNSSVQHPAATPKLESFSSMNNRTLKSLYKEATGHNPVKRKKRKQKLKKSAVATLSSVLQDHPPGSHNSPTPNVRNVATRRIPTANNDDTYHTYDGNLVANREVVHAFDARDISQVELFHSGIHAAVPSEAKHEMTHIERLVPAEQIPVGDYRKTVSLNRSASKDSRQSLTSSAPQWVHLRDNYLRQLESSAYKIIDSFEANSAAHAVSESDIKHFMLLLIALRKVTLRTISEYQYQQEALSNDPYNEHAVATVKGLQKYLFDVPDSLAIIDRAPFLDWIGLHTSGNPLLLNHKVDGAPAAVVRNGQPLQIHPVLQTSHVELKNASDMYAVLWKAYQAETAIPKRPFSRKTGVAALLGIQTQDDLSSDEEEDVHGVLYRLENDPTIRLLKKRTTEAVDLAMNHSRDYKVFAMGLAPIRTYWRAWRSVFANNVKLRGALLLRKCRNRRICFDRLVHNVWQSNKFRQLQQNYHRRVTVICFGAWNEYRKWCRRFQKVYSSSVIRVKALFFNALKRFVVECDELRSFRRRFRINVFRGFFHSLKNNTILSKYELKCRLRNRSDITFWDKHIYQQVFTRWHNRSVMATKIDALEEFLEMTHLKDALIRWVLCTFGPRSQRRARSVAKAKTYMSSLRQSFEKNLSSSWKFLSESMSPLVNASDRRISETERRNEGESRRRLRMLQALEFAKKEYEEER